MNTLKVDIKICRIPKVKQYYLNFNWLRNEHKIIWFSTLFASIEFKPIAFEVA